MGLEVLCERCRASTRTHALARVHGRILFSCVRALCVQWARRYMRMIEMFWGPILLILIFVLNKDTFKLWGKRLNIDRYIEASRVSSDYTIVNKHRKATNRVTR